MANDKKIKQLRRDLLIASYEAGACHIGSALSCLKILIKLYYNILKKGDVFLFAKASGVAALYAILADKKYFSKDKLSFYLKEFPLASKEVPGIIHSVGSLGHGFPVAAGIAYANRKRNVYCLISDAECQEGTTYESALFVRHHKLKNLFVVIDNNGLQACGKTKNILNLDTALIFLKATIPNLSIVNSIKGEGVSFMENDYSWHYRNLTPELLYKALQEND